MPVRLIQPRLATIAAICGMSNPFAFSTVCAQDGELYRMGSSIGEFLLDNQEIMMGNSLTSASLKDGGVTFTVTVEYKTHECLVSQEALSDLCQSDDKKLDLIATYRAYEAKINGVARRLITAGITGSPILLGTRYFG